MPYARLLGFVTLVLVIAGAVPESSVAAAPKAANEVFKLSAQPGEEEGIELNWSIAPGYYLYRDRISVTLNGKALKVATAHGEFKDDPTFGPTEVYHSTATAVVAGDALPEAGEIQVTYQGCGENTICYPPMTKVLNLATLLIADSTGADGQDGITAKLSPGEPALPSQADGEAEGSSLSGNYLSTLAAFLGFGLLLAFTPCVFPMIPILSGMLARSGGGTSVGRSFVLSGSYVVAMATAYGVLGVFAAWSGENLQTALQTPWAIVLMSLIFLALALSMFGLFELRLPQAWSAKLAGAAGNRGSVGGAALLGFGSALIVGPCVTPPLAAALVFIAQTGNIVRGSSALFALGLGMGLPLMAFGALGGKVLPRSGPWLTKINRAFGFVFVGLAIWMASRVLPMWLVAADWGVFFIALGVHLGATGMLSRLSWQSARAFRVAAGGAVAVYGCLILIGAADAMYTPLRPLAFLGLIANAATSGDERSDFLNVSDEGALDAAIASASKQGRMMLIDFSAEWCAECKVMERTVLSQAVVRRQLHGMMLIRADLTHFDQSSKKLMKRFAVVGPPTMIFLNPDGTEIYEARVVGGIGVDGFLTRIAKAIRA